MQLGACPVSPPHGRPARWFSAPSPWIHVTLWSTACKGALSALLRCFGPRNGNKQLVWVQACFSTAHHNPCYFHAQLRVGRFWRACHGAFSRLSKMLTMPWQHSKATRDEGPKTAEPRLPHQPACRKLCLELRLPSQPRK